MNIAHLSTQTAYYGGEVYLVSLAAGMHARGHQVSCCVRPDSELAARLAALKIPTQVLPLVDWFDPQSVIRLRRWLRRNDVQILHSHSPRDYYLAAMASGRTRVVNVGTRHHLHPLRHRYLKRPFLKRFATMIAVSHAVARSLHTSGVIDPDRIVTIHNGVDVLRDLPRRDGLRRQIDLDDATPVIGYVGQLCPDKGVETLLHAVRLLLDAGGDGLHVFVVGEDQCRGRYRHKLERLTHDLDLARSVHFFGYVDDAARAAADFDVQVVCSRAEPFGLVTLEAMAHRHPVVATAAGGSLEIVRDGIDGFLVPAGDAPLLADRLQRLLANPELRRRQGARGRARVVAQFSLARMLDRTESVYRIALESVAMRAMS